MRVGGRRALLRDEGGAAAVEFALVLPVLMLLVMGIIEFSQAYNAKELLQYAVREGARDLALGESEATAEATTRNRAANVPGDPSQIAVTTTPCPPDAVLTGTPGPHTATVEATYDLPYNIPLFYSGEWNLSATGAMRCGG